jgi:hypothetical protein
MQLAGSAHGVGDCTGPPACKKTQAIRMTLPWILVLDADQIQS